MLLMISVGNVVIKSFFNTLKSVECKKDSAFLSVFCSSWNSKAFTSGDALFKFETSDVRRENLSACEVG